MKYRVVEYTRDGSLWFRVEERLFRLLPIWHFRTCFRTIEEAKQFIIDQGTDRVVYES